MGIYIVQVQFEGFESFFLVGDLALKLFDCQFEGVTVLSDFEVDHHLDELHVVCRVARFLIRFFIIIFKFTAIKTVFIGFDWSQFQQH